MKICTNCGKCDMYTHTASVLRYMMSPYRKEKRESYEEAIKPLQEWLRDYYNGEIIVLVTENDSNVLRYDAEMDMVGLG